MRNKCVVFVLIVVITIYITICIYLLGSVDPIKRKLNRFIIERGLPVEKIDLAHQLFKPVCLCDDSIIYTPEKGSHIAVIQAAELNNETCRSLRHTIITADIEVSALYRTLKLHYNNYQFHHRGWISNYNDISYTSSQWDEEPLDVYIVPFSHQDPGWLSTVDSSYNSKTKSTLDLMLQHLTSDPNMTFVWSEIIYLQKWYQSIRPEDQGKLKNLLLRGQLEIVTGGWVMTDEAVAHYYAMLDQLIVGHQWLQNKLNYTVQTSWALDPFGLSPTMPYLLHRSGIHNLLIQRVHYSLKRALADRKQLEFLWRQAWDPGHSTDLFTHIPPFLLYNILYNCGPDPEICCQFDFHHKGCYSKGKYVTPEAISDDNIDEKARTLLDQLRKKAQLFKHNKLLMLYGDDFRFNKASEWDSLNNNVKKLVNYMNLQKNMHVRLKFTTLSGYFDAVKSTFARHSQTVPSLSGDFLTYNDRDDQYWSGYFTSRPLYKYMARQLQQKLRSAEILLSLLSGHVNRQGLSRSVDMVRRLYNSIEEVRQALGLAQHHDAITGTSRSSIMDDYYNRLRDALRGVRYIAGASVSSLLLLNNNTSEDRAGEIFESLDLQTDYKKPIISKVISNDNNVIAIFNPLPTDREEFITVTTKFPFARIEDAEKNIIICQVAPLWTGWLKMKEDTFQVTFRVSLKALAITRFYIQRIDKDEQGQCILAKLRVKSPLHEHSISSEFAIEWLGLESFTLETPLIRAYFCGCTGLMQGVLTRDNQVYHHTKVGFVHYGTGSWTNPLQDKTGAYIFLPTGPAQELEITQPQILIVDGPLMKEVRTKLSMVTHIVTLYDSIGPKGAAVYMENIVNIKAYNNTELAMRVTTDINNARTFYTDNNGFQMQRREYLPQYKIQGNYYPITTQMYIEDTMFRATLHTTYSHGASSLYPGVMEVMLDRRLAQDDWRGLGSGVLDNVITPSNFVLLWETRQKPWKSQNLNQMSHPSILSHLMSSLLNHPAELFLQWREATLPTTPYLPLSISWPYDLHLLNLRSMGVTGTTGGSLLLVHRLAYDCDFVSSYQQCVTSDGKLSMKRMFNNLRIQNIHETLLTGLPLPSTSDAQKPIKHLELPLMEIKAYKLTLH